MMFILFLGFFSAAFTASAAQDENYGTGILCPRSDLQVSFYTENNQQDAAGTIAFGAGTFTLTSDTVKSLEASGAETIDKLCDGGTPALRIDSKRDGWLQAGKMWLPPNQEWDYTEWQDFLRKAPIWKPITPIILYQGTMDEPYRDKPYSTTPEGGRLEIYPLKFVDNYALVLVDKAGAFSKACLGSAIPPEGKMGWLPLTTPTGTTVAIPTHIGGTC